MKENLVWKKEEKIIKKRFTRKVNIKIIGMSDVHGRVLPWNYAADEKDNSGSYAQISTYVKKLRKNNKNVVILSEESYNNMLENMYVMGEKCNYDRLLESKEQLENGMTAKHDLIEVEVDE